MNLKFHMQHDKAAGLQKNKIQAAWESNMADVAKIAKPLKSTFPPEPEPLDIHSRELKTLHQKLEF